MRRRFGDARLAGRLACRFEVAVAVGGRREAVLLLEQLDEMRRVGEGTFDPDFGDGLRRGDQQQTGVHQSLTDIPLVGRQREKALELLLERGERAVAEPRELFDGDVPEDMVIDDLLEILLRRVDIAQQLALDAAILMGGDQVDQLGHLDVLGCFVPQESFVAQVVVGMDEKAADGIPGRRHHVVEAPAVLARVVVGNVESVGDVQVQQDTLELRRG